MRRYTPDDYEALKEWFDGHQMGTPSAEDLPEVGFIEEGYAAGFLIQTDCGVCFLDFFISNPNASYIKKSKSVDAIAEALVESAQSLHYKCVCIKTKLDGAARRSIALGFSEMGSFRTFVRGL